MILMLSVYAHNAIFTSKMIFTTGSRKPRLRGFFAFSRSFKNRKKPLETRQHSRQLTLQIHFVPVSMERWWSPWEDMFADLLSPWYKLWRFWKRMASLCSEVTQSLSPVHCERLMLSHSLLFGRISRTLFFTSPFVSACSSYTASSHSLFAFTLARFSLTYPTVHSFGRDWFSIIAAVVLL